MRAFRRLSVPVLARGCAAAAASADPKGTVRMELPNSSAKIDEFASMYTQLTLKEVTELQRAIFKKLGHSDKFYEEALLRGLGGGGGGGVVVAAAPAVAAPAAAAPEPEKKKEEAPKPAAKSSYDISLVKFPADKKVMVIKEVRRVTNAALTEAKAMVEKGGVFAKGIEKEEAEKLKKILTDLGCQVDLL